MDGNARLTDSTLADSLNAACVALADFYEWSGLNFTQGDIDAIPDRVFKLAIAARWMSKPKEPEDFDPFLEDESSAYLGEYPVQRTFRDEFIAIIRSTLDNLKPMDWEVAELRGIESLLREEGAWTGPERCDDEWLRKNFKITPGATLGELAEQVGMLQKGPSAQSAAQRLPRPTPIELMDRWQHETGLSLEQLAFRANVSPATLYRIRAGKFSYTKARANLSLIASIIGCKWYDLVPIRPH
jgi:hypothetical protein